MITIYGFDNVGWKQASRTIGKEDAIMTIGKTTDETQIRELIEAWAKELRAKRVDALMSHHAPDILLYDLAPPLLHCGVDAYRKGLQEWFATFQGPIDYDIRDLRITAGDDVAFSTSLNWIGGARTNGDQTSVWVRTTMCFKKQGGEWIVMHEHVSVPFYMDGSDKAAIDLEP
jgi:ketosteroid isomerase-like protein